MDNEIRWIKGYEKKYAITKCGRVYSYRRKKWLKANICSGGYRQVNLCGNHHRVHVLVAQTYVEGYQEGLVVNHKDTNKLNNHYLNLEWTTQQKNVEHSLAKTYHFIKDGKQLTVHNLNKFCANNNLDNSAMTKVANGTIEQYEGYKLWTLVS